MMTTESKNFFCSLKFTELSIDIEKRTLRSCNSAISEKVDLQWLQDNPGQLFNTTNLQHERECMLKNQPVRSCENMCWLPEDRGLPSRRQTRKSTAYQTLPIQSIPTHLVIHLGANCNLTCIYCCKEHSSAWFRDIQKHGNYFETDRFSLTAKDRIVDRISQKEHVSSVGTKLLLKEIQNFDQVHTVDIAGGEPFLYNAMPHIVNSLPINCKIRISTGLGVNADRLQHQLGKINDWSRITVVVSAESLHDRFEFVRYGQDFDSFLQNIKILKAHGCAVEFNAVIANVTVFGLPAFNSYFGDHKIKYQFCYEPDFLAANVLDDTSKTQLIADFAVSDMPNKDQIITALQQPCTDQQKDQLKTYLQKFTARRNLSWDIFPRSMLEWLDLEASHVV